MFFKNKHIKKKKKRGLGPGAWQQGMMGPGCPLPDDFIVKLPLYQFLGALRALGALQEFPGLQRAMLPQIPASLN